MKRRVILVGIPGVGKTTVIRDLQLLAEEEKLPCKVVNFGTVMMEIAKETIKDRDKIREAPIEAQHELQRKVAEAIAQERTEGVLIVDTHLIIKTGSGYLPGIPYHVLQGLKPDMIALVEGTPEEILLRRSSDTSRKRDFKAYVIPQIGNSRSGDSSWEVSPIRDVEDDLQFSRVIAFACATLAGIPLGIVWNRAGRQLEAARQLLAMIKD